MVERSFLRTARTFAMVSAVAFGHAQAWAGAPPGNAADTSPIRLELNRLEPHGEACRAYMLIDNSQGDAFRSLKIELFSLDPEGVAQKRIAVEIGPVAARKTTIKLFDFAGQACGKIGRILLNDILACAGSAGPHDDCLTRTQTSSKVAAVAFVK